MMVKALFTAWLLLALSTCGSGSILANSEATLQQLLSLYTRTDVDLSILGFAEDALNCSGKDPGTLWQSLDNCTQYFMCAAGGVAIGPFACPEGQCFDPDPTARAPDGHGYCVPIVAGEDTCNCDSVTPVTPTTPTSAPPQCIDTCTEEGDQIYFHDDCGRHASCTGPDSYVDFFCPADRPFFDGMVCGTDESLCCTCQPPICIKELATNGTLLPDPLDCHSYYVCVLLHEEVLTMHSTCEEGGSFIAGKCQDKAKECTNECDLGRLSTIN